MPRLHDPNVHLAEPGSLKNCDDPKCDAIWNAYCEDATTVYCDFMCGAKVHPDMTNHAEVVHAFYHWRQHPVTGGCSHGN